MKIPFYQVDAFANRVFSGNSAAICPLSEWLPTETLQAIAMENNLAETAYFVPEGDGYRLRWFTPSVEVDLCGHATLASAFVLMEHLQHSSSTISFETLSGQLSVSREGDMYTLDFPARPAHRGDLTKKIVEAIGLEPTEFWQARDMMAVFDNEQQIRAIHPDMALLAQLDTFALMVTAPGIDCDFVSRFFAPQNGIVEDPATGSSHCTLAPYWAEKLGKTKLHSRQLSQRGGEFWCEMQGDRVKISGQAVLFATGEIHI